MMKFLRCVTCHRGFKSFFTHLRNDVSRRAILDVESVHPCFHFEPTPTVLNAYIFITFLMVTLGNKQPLETGLNLYSDRRLKMRKRFFSRGI